jgi:hypothetical protein
VNSLKRSEAASRMTVSQRRSTSHGRTERSFAGQGCTLLDHSSVFHSCERASYSLTARSASAFSIAFWSSAVIFSSPSRMTTFPMVPVNLNGTW